MQPVDDSSQRHDQWKREIIRSDKAPSYAHLPLSPATRFGGLVFAAGQLSIDPATGKAVPGDIGEQTRVAPTNLKAILEAGGASLGSALKVNCYLANLDDFAGFNAVYAEFFPSDPPARTTFQVARLASPYLVEIEAIAAVVAEIQPG